MDAHTAGGLDVITLGRSSVDLYGQQIGSRLEDMASFAKYVGGSPTNTAIGAARLGLKAGLITRVGADHMGRFILEALHREGIDTRGVVTDPARLTALVLLGIVDKETFPLIFYRENCADMAIDMADIDPAWLASARALVVDGTHLSQPGVYAASLEAIRQVKAAGGKIAFDIDYRPVLWGLTSRDMGEQRYVANPEVTQRLAVVTPLCDLIIGTEEEVRILGGSDDVITALKAIRAATDAVLVCKLGAEGCAIFDGAVPDRIEDGLVVPGFPIDIMNVLGAGDAFSAGFLRGWLGGEDLATCGRWANACGALVVTRHSCAPAMPSFEELQAFLAIRHPMSPADQARLDHLHWSYTRHRDYEALMILAMDHRFQFEEMAADLGADMARISAFKRLALRAVDSLANGSAAFGVLLDGRYGADALSEAGHTTYWIGRPVEVPKSRPLRFETGADVGLELNTWPANQVVKCLVLYHPDDEETLRAEQERQLVILFDACRKSGHELLLELILPPDMPADKTTRSRGIQRLYDLGIKPDWWKLEPVTDPCIWENIDAAIAANDPLCRGVVVLGLSAPEDELLRAFEVAARFECVKGFAIGRTIFHDVAARWLKGEMDDAGAVEAMASKLSRLVTAWRDMRRRPVLASLKESVA
ncbi:5-dehydro-2-deoxygluconokinase [Asticcacaulis sp. AC460]|uniref:bifunctional 5-dehydro-2-deoxygluconokinase/5-dehydro-2- deoxyphosphogluconate aldolase n=1 Tax=Asticcacaulis sp. AC460 TaxID=1282360 RepID=UPI0003C3B893|nr:5-dehydro-2-deoxygluconokinase [Asticcacaulis sp. AC460]ESQ86965.1 5-dehydro-2-deoxygluconokinase [Asticcacaulis sp. AC460]